MAEETHRDGVASVRGPEDADAGPVHVRAVPEGLDSRRLIVHLDDPQPHVDGVEGLPAAPAGAARIEGGDEKAEFRQGGAVKKRLVGTVGPGTGINVDEERVFPARIEVRGKVQHAVKVGDPVRGFEREELGFLQPQRVELRQVACGQHGDGPSPASMSRVTGAASWVWATSTKCFPFGAMVIV